MNFTERAVDVVPEGSDSSVRVKFYIAPQCLTGDGGRRCSGIYRNIRLETLQMPIDRLFNRYINGSSGLVGAFEKIPRRHLMLLGGNHAVPIIIVNLGMSGGWVSPGGQDRDRFRIPHDGYHSWTSGGRVRRFGGDDAIIPEGIQNASNGLILISLRALQKSTHKRQSTILHEMGHCVDFNLNLDSEPGNTSYRNGNRAYQGQRYHRGGGTGYNRREFIAETYSRLFMNNTRMCRGVADTEDSNPADPLCINRDGHRNSHCNRRLKIDLAHTLAFRGLTNIPQFSNITDFQSIVHASASLDFLMRPMTIDEGLREIMAGVGRGANSNRDQQTILPVGRRPGLEKR